MPDVFVSYARADGAAMQRIRGALEEVGASVWYDDHVEPGSPDWQDAIEDALASARCVVVVLSPNAKRSEWVKREIAFASLHDLQILPVLAEGPPQDAIPLLLVRAQYIDLTQDWETQLKRLQEAAQSILGIQPSEPEEVKTDDQGGQPPFAAASLTFAPPSPRLMRLRQWLPGALLLTLFVALTLLSTHFWDIRNLQNIAVRIALYGLPAVGLTIVVLKGGLDFSLGALVSLSAICAARCSLAGASALTSCIVTVAVAIIVGGVQGFLITRARHAFETPLDDRPVITRLVPTMLITFLSQALIYSLLPALADTYLRPSNFPSFTEHKLLHVPIAFLGLIVFALSVDFALRGNGLYATWREACVTVGRTHRQVKRDGVTLLLGYVSLAALAGVTGLLHLSYIGVAEVRLGMGLEITILTAVVVGGTSVLGRGGSVLRSLVGVSVLVVLENGMLLLGWPYYITDLARIVLLIAFLWLDYLSMPRPILVEPSKTMADAS